ncbi:hypothetical protein [Actinoplanes auranticolor]|uniref:hypothetical protein n=1 Tax=Actinoplanes auranticolor TaxID=47988 RepID=UPI001BB44381|nr:hypothetical protein [Actinoplanes auranticolor]
MDDDPPDVAEGFGPVAPESASTASADFVTSAGAGSAFPPWLSAPGEPAAGALSDGSEATAPAAGAGPAPVGSAMVGSAAPGPVLVGPEVAGWEVAGPEVLGPVLIGSSGICSPAGCFDFVVTTFPVVAAVVGGHSGFGGVVAAGSGCAPLSALLAWADGPAVVASATVPDDLSGLVAPAAAGAPLVWACVGGGSATAGVADGPTASPCVVTGKACLIYAFPTTGTRSP